MHGEPNVEPDNENVGIKNNGIEYEASRGMKNRKVSQEYKETACNSDIKISDEQIKLIEDVLREYLA